MSANRSVGAAVVAHHLRLFGVTASERPGVAPVTVCTDALPSDDGSDNAPGRRRVAVVIQPCPDLLARLGLSAAGEHPAPSQVEFTQLPRGSSSRVRSLHVVRAYQCERRADVVAVDSAGRPCWVWAGTAWGDVLVVGTDLGEDLVRFRQGDPARAAHRPQAALWGIPGERPTYLFDTQIPPGAQHERPADDWARALAQIIAARCGETLPPLVPGGAPGVLVVTGDDDQAYLEKYDEQLGLLGGLPVTYFLHPLTRHRAPTLKAMAEAHSVEIGLHPDALDQPHRYTDLFREQNAWFERLTGHRATLVRNHGFLNDGYWGHLPVWLDEGVRASTNLPGVDGTILNGSLLPSRVTRDGRLTAHWSVLTAIGDGVRFALGMDGPQSAQCIRGLADRIERSALPGVIVLNLHPQNVGETAEMHAVLHELIGRGFAAMTLGACIDWFQARDAVCP